jgi:hypothetical protein
MEAAELYKQQYGMRIRRHKNVFEVCLSSRATLRKAVGKLAANYPDMFEQLEYVGEYAQESTSPERRLEIAGILRRKSENNYTSS